MQPLVTCILPCRGRFDQTVEVGMRLRERAGFDAAAWWAVGGAEDGDTVHSLAANGWQPWVSPLPRLTYWQALAAVTEAHGGDVLCCLANDLDPAPGWLANGIKAYLARFSPEGGLMGFAGDGHGPHHSCHFLIGRQFLAELGGWPTWFKHNFGDTELCLRAQELGRYGKATRAVLNHRHPSLAAAIRDDAVYREGRADWNSDEQLFRSRRAANWPAVRGS